MEADESQKAILQRWRSAVVEDATEAASKMQVIENQAVHVQEQALVQQIPQQAEQHAAEDEVALQTLVQQSRSRRQAKLAREVAQSPQEQRMAAIQVDDEEPDPTLLQLGLDRTGLKTVPKQKARATTPDPTKLKLRALQLEVETEQQTAMQQLVQVQSNSARASSAHSAPGASRAVSAICEEIGLTPRAKESLGATSLQDFQYISFANLEDAAGRVLTIVERNRLSMTLQAEGVQLLGEKDWTGLASREPLACCDHSTCSSSVLGAPTPAPCKHDSASTQVTELAAEHLQIVQWRGAATAEALAMRACAHATTIADEVTASVCAHAARRQGAATAVAKALNDDKVQLRSGRQLALCTTNRDWQRDHGGAAPSPTELEAASQHLWQSLAQGADGLDRLKPRNGAGMVIFGWPGTRNYIEAAANDRHPEIWATLQTLLLMHAPWKHIGLGFWTVAVIQGHRSSWHVDPHNACSYLACAAGNACLQLESAAEQQHIQLGRFFIGFDSQQRHRVVSKTERVCIAAYRTAAALHHASIRDVPIPFGEVRVLVLAKSKHAVRLLQAPLPVPIPFHMSWERFDRIVRKLAGLQGGRLLFSAVEGTLPKYAVPGILVQAFWEPTGPGSAQASMPSRSLVVVVIMDKALDEPLQ
eukprot:4865151-Amphidinium_carterae.1